MARVPVVGFTYAQVEAALRALFGVPASAENFIGGFPVFGTPELTEIRRLDPSLLVINLTGPVRAVGEALRAAASSLTEAEQVPPGLAFRAKRGAKESP